MIKISKKYKKNIIPLYKRFATNICDEEFLKFDENSEEQIFIFETYGKNTYEEIYNKNIPNDNGFLQGKKWLDLTITMWIEDIKNGLFWFEELDDEIKNNKIILKAIKDKK